MYDDLDPAEFEATAQSVIEACGKATDPAARARLLAEAGLLGVLAPETVGGLGLPMRFAVPIASAAGAGLLAFPLIESMVLARALAGVDPDMAGAICAGEVLATIAWSGMVEDGSVGRAPMAEATAQVLVFRADGGSVLMPGGAVAGDSGYDITVPEGTLRLTDGNGIALDAVTTATLRADADLLRTAMILGSAATCLALASDHAQERIQFGRPLSAYQALRHRMARDAVVIETLRSGIARALAEPAEGADVARDALWVWAAQAGPGVAESAIQVLGGMGFTWDVPLHRHLRRMQTLALQGGARARMESLATAVLGQTDNDWYKDIADAV